MRDEKSSKLNVIMYDVMYGVRYEKSSKLNVIMHDVLYGVRLMH